MLLDRLNDDLKAAMKARDKERVDLIRLVLSDAKNARIKKGEALSEADVVAVLKRGVKMRSESIEQFRRGGRQDLVDHEEREIDILRGYLPEPLTGTQLVEVVEAAIRQTGATTIKDMGSVMKAVLAQHGARVDGKEVQSLVRARLGSG